MKHLSAFYAACVLVGLLVSPARPRRSFRVVGNSTMLTEVCEALAPCVVNLTEVSK